MKLPKSILKKIYLLIFLIGIIVLSQVFINYLSIYQPPCEGETDCWISALIFGLIIYYGLIDLINLLVLIILIGGIILTINTLKSYKKIFKPTKVLGIHGYTGNPKKNDWWKSMKNNLFRENISMIIPQFPESRNTKFSEWENILDSQDLSKIDTVIGHSLGTRVATEYIIKNNINLERLILVSPTITAKRTNGSDREELIHFFDDYEIGNLDARFTKLNKLVKQILVISSYDDEVVPCVESKKFSEIIGAKFIQVTGYDHFNGQQYDILENLVQFGDIK